MIGWEDEIKYGGLDGYLQEIDIMKTEEEKVNEERDSDEEEWAYADGIYNAIKRYNSNSLELSTFATGNEVEGALGIPSVHVDGVGRVAYPLCMEQKVSLLSVSRRGTFEKETDASICQAWQIESNLVHINPKWVAESLPKLMTDCCKEMGINAAEMDVRANLCKMLIYEEGGHFKKHRDAEKEPGMFGSLLVQLPAEYEGGDLVVEHEEQHKRYSFSKESADKVYCAAFYADCERTLEPLTKGLRLVLDFNLVRGPSVVPAFPLGPATAAHRKGCEEMLVASTKHWCSEKSAVRKLALPLAYKYTHTSATFAGLKGTDLSAVNLLQNAVDPETGKKLFSVYLALVTKRETGTSNAEEPRERYGSGRYGRYGYDFDSDDDSCCGATGMDSEYGVDITYETVSWVGPAGEVQLGSLEVDFGTEIITALGAADADEASEDIFGSERDGEEDEGYGGALEYWYDSAVLVFWPAQRDFEIKLAASLPQAVECLKQIDRTSADYADQLGRLLTFLASGDARKTWHLSSVLPLTQTAEQVRAVLGLGHTALSKTDHAAIVTEVGKHGWQELGESFTALFRAQPPLVMTELLASLESHGVGFFALISTSSTTQAAEAAPLAAWSELLRVLVDSLLQSTAAPYTHTYGYAAPTSSMSAVGSAKPIVAEKDWVELSRFVIAHCEVADQEAVAAHVGKLLSLQSLNCLLEQLLPSVGGVFDGPFQARLRECAVQRCVDTRQLATDVYAVLTWVVRGGFADLATELLPALKRLCDNDISIRGLFALPLVREVLLTESALSRELESLVQARIADIQPKAVRPPSSWQVPAGSFFTSDPHVAPFMASDRTTTSLTGMFTGIAQARQWAAQHFRDPLCGVSAEAFGVGNRAGVKLTKYKLVAQQAELKRCTEFETELRGLRKLLRVRDRASAQTGVAAGSTVDGGASVGPVERVGAAAAVRMDGVVVIDVDGGPPAQKKAKVEPHIYVIA